MQDMLPGLRKPIRCAFRSRRGGEGRGEGKGRERAMERRGGRRLPEARLDAEARGAGGRELVDELELVDGLPWRSRSVRHLLPTAAHAAHGGAGDDGSAWLGRSFGMAEAMLDPS